MYTGPRQMMKNNKIHKEEPYSRYNKAKNKAEFVFEASRAAKNHSSDAKHVGEQEDVTQPVLPLESREKSNGRMPRPPEHGEEEECCEYC